MTAPAPTRATHGSVPELRKNDQGDFVLTFDLPGGSTQLELGAEQVSALGQQFLHHFPDLQPGAAEPPLAEALRGPARIVGQLGDRSLQVLLREVAADDLIDFLWYMKDAAIARRVLDNMSARSGEALFELMQIRYGRCDPDAAPPGRADPARAATATLLKTLQALADQGMITVS